MITPNSYTNNFPAITYPDPINSMARLMDSMRPYFVTNNPYNIDDENGGSGSAGQGGDGGSQSTNSNGAGGVGILNGQGTNGTAGAPSVAAGGGSGGGSGPLTPIASGTIAGGAYGGGW